MMNYLISAIIGVVYTALLVFCGWQIHGWYTGYKDNQQAQVQKAVDKSLSDVSRSFAQSFEQQKQDYAQLSQNFDDTLKNLSSTKTIYKNVCLDQDAVDALTELKIKSQKMREGNKQ